MPILLAVTAGLRRGEVLGARWDDLDLDAGVLRVRQSLEQTAKGLAFKPPKTQKSWRVVALPPLTVEALRHHKTEQAKLRLLLGPGYEDQGLICARPDGRPTDPRSVSHAFAVLLRRHNLP